MAICYGDMSPQYSHAHLPPCGRGRAALKPMWYFRTVLLCMLERSLLRSFSPRHTLEVSSTMNTLIMNILMCLLSSQPRSAQQRQAAGAFSLSPPLWAALPGTWEGSSQGHRGKSMYQPQSLYPESLPVRHSPPSLLCLFSRSLFLFEVGIGPKLKRSPIQVFYTLISAPEIKETSLPLLPFCQLESAG